MKKKTELSIFMTILILWILVMNTHFFGCASTAPKQELSPERQQAIQDSLNAEHAKRIALWFSFGYEPYKQGNYQRAKNHFLRVARADTAGIADKRLYEFLGTCYLQLQIPDSAKWAYEMGIERNPSSPYSYKALGYLYRMEGKTEQAVELYERLIKLEPDSTENYRTLGELYVALHEPNNAIGAYQEIIQRNPNDKDAQDMLSQLYETQDIDAVITHRENMIKQFPNDMQLRQDLAESYFTVGEFDKAIEQLEMVTSEEPDNLAALKMLGKSYQETDQFNIAITTLNKVLAINAEDKNTLCDLALSQASLGRFSSALQNANKALALDAQYGVAFMTRGFIYETAADRCVAENDGKRTFDDKLVYQMAYDEYNKAKASFETQREATRAANALANIIPTAEDRFMNPNKTRPTSPCYSWMN
ncbi:tetratricopeptide repeat protein [bacterium]|nr:tetratricopeptide repeat protein [bacterium]RQV95985.1 MAG: tetratricopeptide repeat protein [bacterium]